MKRVTYKSSGVDINKAEAFVKSIKGAAAGTFGPGVLKRTGAFGSLFAPDISRYRQPVLVSSSDGVGTKLMVAQAAGRHDTVGIDLVAMNINDLLCVGAKPLFFLDYIACGRLNPKILKDVIKGIAKGCKLSGCALIGGETAEMPGMYSKEDYDLAGFAVGLVDKSKIIDGSRLVPGDRLIGLPSSGLHSNGYSLVRKVFSQVEIRKRAADLLRPTRIYVREILQVIRHADVKGIAHITGGAFYDKLTKIVPRGLCFSIDRRSWKVPSLFADIQRSGGITDREMYRTFNMGIGMVIAVGEKDFRKTKEFLKRGKVRYFDIGSVVKDAKPKVMFNQP